MSILIGTEMMMPFTEGPPESSPTLHRWFGNERRFWTLASVVLGLCAVLKAWAPPADWPLTQAQLDYSHGVIKRGLAGAIYRALHWSTVKPLTVVFNVELVIFFVLLSVFAVRSGLARRFGSPIVVALFAGSYAVTFLTHILGYTDLVAASLAVGLLLIRRPELRFLCALPAFIVAMLMHENFLLLFAPLVLLSFVLDAAADKANRKRYLVFAAVLGVLAAGIALYTSLQPNMTPEQADQFEQYVDDHADFNVRDDFFQVLSAGFKQNLRGVWIFGLKTWRYYIYLAVSLFNLLPLFLLLVRLGRRLLGSVPWNEEGWMGRRGLTAAAVLATLCPLALYAMGIDCVRWNTWVATDAFIVLCLLCRHLPGPGLTLSAAERNAIVLAIAVGMISGHGLFNGSVVNAYPFFPQALKDFILLHDGPLPGF